MLRLAAAVLAAAVETHQKSLGCEIGVFTFGVPGGSSLRAFGKEELAAQFANGSQSARQILGPQGKLSHCRSERWY